MGFRSQLAMAVPENRVRFTGHPEHVHDVPHLVHMVMGRGTLQVREQQITMEPRTSVWLAAGVPHSLRLDDHSIALGPFLSPHVSPGVAVRRLGVIPDITDLMLARLAAQPVTREQRALFNDGLDEILSGLTAERFSDPLPVHPTCHQIALAAVTSPLTLTDLCARAGISTRQAQRVFLSETGVPFQRWRTRRRLNTAVQLLRSGSREEAAARQSGFASRSGLLRALSRETQIPLEDLRQDVLSALEDPRRSP